jgi:hypothetical protein
MAGLLVCGEIRQGACRLSSEAFNLREKFVAEGGMIGAMKRLGILISGMVLAAVVAAAAQTGPQTASQPASQAATQTAPATQTMPATQGRDVIRDTIPIPPAPVAASAGSLSGRLLDASGRPVAGAIVTFSSREPPAPGQAPVPPATSAPDGTFTLKPFPAGQRRCTLTVTQTGVVIGSVDMTASVVAGQNTRLDQDIRLNGPTAVPIRQR